MHVGRVMREGNNVPAAPINKICSVNMNWVGKRSFDDVNGTGMVCDVIDLLDIAFFVCILFIIGVYSS